MRIIAKEPLRCFWQTHPDSKGSLIAWLSEAKTAAWKNPAEVRNQYGSASILKNHRIVFNICGNKYRLVVSVNYSVAIVYIRFIGTHKQYDAIDAKTI